MDNVQLLHHIYRGLCQQVYTPHSASPLSQGELIDYGRESKNEWLNGGSSDRALSPLLLPAFGIT